MGKACKKLSGLQSVRETPAKILMDFNLHGESLAKNSLDFNL
jgi:hypothetical protein